MLQIQYSVKYHISISNLFDNFYANSDFSATTPTRTNTIEMELALPVTKRIESVGCFLLLSLLRQGGSVRTTKQVHISFDSSYFTYHVRWKLLHKPLYMQSCLCLLHNDTVRLNIRCIMCVFYLNMNTSGYSAYMYSACSINVVLFHYGLNMSFSYD